MSRLQKIQQTIKLVFFPTAAAMLIGTSAHAAESVCYNIPLTNEISAEASTEVNVQSRTEKWCYQGHPESGELFIYNADESQVSPEMSMLIDQAGMITHGSLNAGAVTIHKVNSADFIPFNVPIKEPTELKRSLISTEDIATLNASAAEVLQLFRENVSSPVNFSVNSYVPFATATNLPWRGYWYPRRNMPMLTPLRKYDRFVAARSGNPGAAAWESRNHAFHGVSWSGHCNGWAAAAIIRSEPRSTKTDSRSGTTFSIADQKGLLTELDYCVKTAFYGNRNRGGGNNGDIRPELFHKTVIHYIGNLRKPVVMDIHSNSAVDNHVVSGYSMNIQRVSATRQVVTATMNFHKYDSSRTNSTGVAPRYTKVYKYNLTTDSSGRPIGGSWISGNPDFIWVPLAPGRCGSNNQRVTNSWVTTITGL